MLTLNYRDSRPIYQQIKDGLMKLILTGAIAENEKLPSVRSLAMELAINPNTIQRAYAELESEGVIYSVAGKGSFAAPQNEAAAVRKEELYTRLCAIAAELRELGATEEEILVRLKGGNTK